MPISFEVKRVEYDTYWRMMTFDQSKFMPVAKRLYADLTVYKNLEAKTGVPAAMLMVINEREQSGRLTGHLHNGDPLTARTRHVPAGRPVAGSPPFTFEASALDAIHYEHLDLIKVWTIPVALWFLEQYNGLGYAYKNLPSPYLWGGTNIQKPGKYISDGVFDPTVMDSQPGCAPLLAALFTLDPALRFPSLAAPIPDHVPVRPPPPAPTPVPAGILASILALIAMAGAGLVVAWDWLVHFFGGG